MAAQKNTHAGLKKENWYSDAFTPEEIRGLAAVAPSQIEKELFRLVSSGVPLPRGDIFGCLPFSLLALMLIRFQNRKRYRRAEKKNKRQVKGPNVVEKPLPIPCACTRLHLSGKPLSSGVLAEHEKLMDGALGVDAGVLKTLLSYPYGSENASGRPLQMPIIINMSFEGERRNDGNQE